MENIHLAHFFYPNSNRFIENFSNQENINFLSNLSQRSMNEIKQFINDNIINGKYFSYEMELKKEPHGKKWGIMDIRFNFPINKNYCVEMVYSKQFKEYIVLEIEFYGFSSNDNVYVSSYQEMLEIISILRNLFIKSKAVYGFFPFYGDKIKYYPIEKDIENGQIAIWTTQNLFSKDHFEKIPKKILPPKNILIKSCLPNGNIEFVEQSENQYFTKFYISNEEFFNKRFGEKQISSEEIEKKIQRIINMTKSSMCSIDYDGLRELGISKERIESIIRDLTEYCWISYEKYSGTAALTNVIKGYKILKDKKGTVKVINIYLDRYERTKGDTNLKNIINILKWNEMELIDIEKISPETYRKLIEYLK